MRTGRAAHVVTRRGRGAKLARALTIGLLAVLLAGCDSVGDWFGFLGGPSHTSIANDTGIGPAAVNALAPKWRFALPAVAGRSRNIWATPASWQGTLYVAGDTGMLYALNQSDGSVRWSRDFGVVPMLHCHDAQGIVGSPAVRDAGGQPYVYINAPDGYLYELDGLTGDTVWRSVVRIPSPTVNDTFPWSSPTLYGGKVYVGISSNCDSPFVRGGVKSYDAASGKPIASGWTMPLGYQGAGVWTSVAADHTGVYVTTGSVTDSVQAAHPPTVTNDFDQYSIVKFDPNTLKRTGKWVAPTTTVYDPDFASSPILFEATLNGTATPMVGGCRKDGYFYAVRTDTMELVWSRQVMHGASGGQSNCLGGGVFDGTRLFLAGGLTEIAGHGYYGAVRRVDPATGDILWERGLPAVPLGAGTYNKTGLLAYSTAGWYNPPGSGVFILDPETGAQLRMLKEPNSSPSFAQPIWVDGQLFATSLDAVVDWKP